MFHALASSRVQLADFLCMAPLRALCGCFMASSLSVNNVAALMEAACEVNEQTLIDACMALVESRTDEVACLWFSNSLP